MKPPTTTIAAGTLDETITSSQAAITPTTTTSSCNKHLPLSKSFKKSRTIEEGKTSTSSMATATILSMNAWSAEDSSCGRRQHPKLWEKTTPLKANTTTYIVKMISVPLKHKRNDEGLLTITTPICKKRSSETKTVWITELDSYEKEAIEENSID